MAEGGTIKARLDKVTKELEEESKLWAQARLPDSSQMFRMGDGEFQHHCHVETITRLLKDVIGIDEDQMNLTYREVVLGEMRTLRQAAAEMRKQALRNDIVRGVPLLPPIEPEI